MKVKLVGCTVERFPLVPSRPAMNPSAMAAAVARHQVTKQTKRQMLADEETKSKIFPKHSSLMSNRWRLVALEKKLAQFWQSKAKCGLCIKKFECLTRIVVAPQWQVWSRPKQLLVGSVPPSTLGDGQGCDFMRAPAVRL